MDGNEWLITRKDYYRMRGSEPAIGMPNALSRSLL